MIDLSELNLPNIIAGLLLSGLVGWGIWVTKWIIGHNRECHRAPNDKLIELRKDVDQLSREIGHATTKGSVLERMHRYSKWLRDMRQRLDMEDDPE